MNDFTNHKEKLFRAVRQNKIRKDGTIAAIVFLDKKGLGTSVQRQFDVKGNYMRETDECIHFMEICGFKENIVSITLEDVEDVGAICVDAHTDFNPYHCELYTITLDPLDELMSATLSERCKIEKRV